MPQENYEPTIYGRSLRGRWAQAYTDAANYTYEELIKDAFYVSHGRILNLIQGGGRLRGEAAIIMQAADVLVEQGEISLDFVEELRLRLQMLSPNEMIQLFQSTLFLAEGAARLSKASQIARQLEICKTFIVNILKHSEERRARELAIACIQELKLDAELPLEDLEILINRVINDGQNISEDSNEEFSGNNPENNDPESDLWED